MTNLNLSDVRIFLCTTPTKMSYSFDTLMGQAQKVFDQDPLSGHLFLFFNRSSPVEKKEAAKGVSGPTSETTGIRIRSTISR